MDWRHSIRFLSTRRQAGPGKWLDRLLLRRLWLPSLPPSLAGWLAGMQTELCYSTTALRYSPPPSLSLSLPISTYTDRQTLTQPQSLTTATGTANSCTTQRKDICIAYMSNISVFKSIQQCANRGKDICIAYMSNISDSIPPSNALTG